MRHWLRIGLVIAAIVFGITTWNDRSAAPHDATEAVADGPLSPATDPVGHEMSRADVPAEAVSTLAAIAAGGPLRYARDGTEFYNREQSLPKRPGGYYREYTVDTPGAGDRGARRIITGGEPPEVYYYTDDHYRTFRRIEVANGR